MTDLTPHWPFTAEEVDLLHGAYKALLRVAAATATGDQDGPLKKAHRDLGLVLALMGYLWPEDKVLPEDEPTVRQLLVTLTAEVAELRRSLAHDA